MTQAYHGQRHLRAFGLTEPAKSRSASTDVRVKVDMECDAPKPEVDTLIDHVVKWSPVANTFIRAVNLEVTPKLAAAPGAVSLCMMCMMLTQPYRGRRT